MKYGRLLKKVLHTSQEPRQYKMRLQTLKKESLSMRAFLSQVKSCCDLLGAAGCKISEEDQIMHILSGLGTDYNPVMVTVTSKTEGWTVQDVSAILMSYESRLEEIMSSSISADASLPSAHLVQSNQRSNLSSNNNYRNDGGEVLISEEEVADMEAEVVDLVEKSFANCVKNQAMELINAGTGMSKTLCQMLLR